MRISIRYMAQVRQAAGVASEQVDLDVPCSVRDVLVQMAERRGDPLRKTLLTSDGRLQPTLLLFVGDRQIGTDEPAQLQDGDALTILSPIAGG